MGYQNLALYFKTNFSLMNHHKWSIAETEDMMPWERQVYIDLLLKFLDEEKEKIKEEKRRDGAKT